MMVRSSMLLGNPMARRFYACIAGSIGMAIFFGTIGLLLRNVAGVGDMFSGKWPFVFSWRADASGLLSPLVATLLAFGAMVGSLIVGKDRDGWEVCQVLSSVIVVVILLTMANVFPPALGPCSDLGWTGAKSFYTGVVFVALVGFATYGGSILMVRPIVKRDRSRPSATFGRILGALALMVGGSILIASAWTSTMEGRVANQFQC